MVLYVARILYSRYVISFLLFRIEELQSGSRVFLLFYLASYVIDLCLHLGAMGEAEVAQLVRERLSEGIGRLWSNDGVLRGHRLKLTVVID